MIFIDDLIYKDSTRKDIGNYHIKCDGMGKRTLKDSTEKE